MTIDAIQLTPEQPTLDARHFDKLIDLWLEDMKPRTAKQTASDYRDKMGYVREWWTIKGPSYDWAMSEATTLDFAHWLSERVSRFGRPLGYNTRRDALRRLRQLFLWAWKKGYVANDYSKWVPAPVGSAPLRKASSVGALRRLIEAAASSQQPLRDRAILAVLLGTGIRRSECASINIEDVQIDADGSGVITVQAKRVKGREIHSRHVAFDMATGAHIRAWVDVLRQPSGPLFPSHRPEQPRLTKVGIYRVVKKLIRMAGLESEIEGPHDLRRYFATYYSRHRRGEAHGQLLSKQLGHSTYRMTAHYSLQDVEDVRAALISPFALMKEEGGK
jgi:site-specific recombinase XerD